MNWLKKLVLIRTDARLFGKVLTEQDDTLDVEFFRSVSDREALRLSKRAVAHVALPVETRLFVEASPGFWRVGRVIDKYKDDQSGAFSYAIKFPNDEAIELPEDACFVRCLDRYADPSRILAAGCMETQYFADRRRSAMRRLRSLRSAAQGLVGVLSAAVDLVPHQIATVRRVITDRTLRYLLADEVGLGKTIEAGLIIRQLLLDDPALSVEVLVPSTLVNQWREELDSKCLLADADVTVRSHDQIAEFDDSMRPTLLVVDEAHRLILPCGTQAQVRDYELLRKLSLRVPKLLLLSATPALGDEARLLALLNLLDPISYPLDDLEEFRARAMARQPIGRLLLAMRPGSPAFSLRQQAMRAKEMFPDDAVVFEEADRLLLSADDPVKRDVAVVALRDHIANTYRIHQRLIRARRVDVEKWTMRPRGPEWPVLTHVRLRFSADPHAEGMLEALEAWRDVATGACGDNEQLAGDLARIWRALLDGAWQGGNALANAARSLVPTIEGEADALLEIARVGEARALAEDRYSLARETIATWLKELGRDASGRPKKLVCFASNANDARLLAEHLTHGLGAGQVFSMVGLGEETAAAVDDFALSATIRVAVCDRAGEEGLNLQFVHGIFHMDLPFDASRVEQRVGRLDRFGRRLDRVENRVFLPSEDDQSPWKMWFGLLANGFRVFNNSISDVQFRVESLESEIGLRMFRDGVYREEELASHVAAQIADERQKLDEQHALDNLSQLTEAGNELVSAIEASEEDEAELASDIEPWIRQVLGLRLEAVGNPEARAIQVTWTSDTLLPAIPWRSSLEAALRQRWTWRRRQSVTKGRFQSALLRPGSALMEALERIAQWDDRGIAYATLRTEPEWPGVWRGFRMVWLIEPALDPKYPVHSRLQCSETARRAEAFLPTLTVELYVEEDGSIVKDAKLVGILSRPYNQHRDAQRRHDTNLGSRPDELHEVIDQNQFVLLVEHVTHRAREFVLDNAQVAAALEAARAACERDVRRARRGLDVREALAGTQPGMVERPRPEEWADLKTLQLSVDSPNVRLDEIGFIVLTATEAA